MDPDPDPKLLISDPEHWLIEYTIDPPSFSLDTTFRVLSYDTNLGSRLVHSICPLTNWVVANTFDASYVRVFLGREGGDSPRIKAGGQKEEGDKGVPSGEAKEGAEARRPEKRQGT